MNTSSSATDIVITFLHCEIYRLIGFLLLTASVTNICVSLRYFLHRYLRKKTPYRISRLSPIITAMLISSILVIFTGIPLVAIQCFACRSYLSYDIICKIHALMCLSTGLFNMYIVAYLSFFRYLSVLHKPSCLYRLLEQHCHFSVLVCALLATCWSLPSFFGIGNKFVREGVGFYCSLDWKNPAIHSRIFLISMVVFNYVIPFILLVYSNVRVCFTLRRLLKTRETSKGLFFPQGFSVPTRISLSPALRINMRKCLCDAQSKEIANRLQRLKIDRRYTFVTAIIAGQYLIAWTPYACIEVINLSGRSTFAQKNPFVPTFCALLAKLSLILNPLILIYMNKITKA